MKTKVRLIEASELSDLEDLINKWIEETESMEKMAININSVLVERVLDAYGSRSYETTYIATIQWLQRVRK